MKHVFQSILFCLALTAANAQNQANTTKPDIEYSINTRNYILGGVTIDGVNDYDYDQLLRISGLVIGQTITFPKAEGEVTTALRNLWDQRVFSDVSITADSIVGRNIYLHIQLAPHPKLSSVTYSGIKKSEREDLEEIFPLKEGSVISVDVINRIKFVINKHFGEKGFKNVTTEVIQRNDPKDKNKVTLEIDIDKHEKVKVHRIYITGADQDKINKLKASMKKTRESGKLRNILKSKKFIEEKYKEDNHNGYCNESNYNISSSFQRCTFQCFFHHGKYRLCSVHIDQGGTSHHCNIHRIKSRINDNSCKKTVNTQLCLKYGCHKARAYTCSHSCKN